MFGVFSQVPWLYELTPAWTRQKHLVKQINTFIDNVITTRKLQLQEKAPKSDNNNEEADFGIKDRKSFLDLLLESSLDGRPLTYEEIRQEVNTFMFAGHDTTTSAITFAIYNIAQHPDIQQKLFDEQKSLMGEDLDTCPNYNDLMEMKYMEMVIKESLRFHPSVPLIARETMEPIEIGGVQIPTGITLNISIYTLHRNPHIYPHAEKFIPERFTEEEAAKRGPYDYVPFSAGSRNCLGQRFAMLEIKSVLSSIIRNFELRPTPKTKEFKYAADLVLRPLNGLFIEFNERIY